MARSDNGDDGLWKEIAEEVYKDADRLFKMIGEAYAVLSDPTKVELIFQNLELFVINLSCKFFNKTIMMMIWSFWCSVHGMILKRR